MVEQSTPLVNRVHGIEEDLPDQMSVARCSPMNLHIYSSYSSVVIAHAETQTEQLESYDKGIQKDIDLISIDKRGIQQSCLQLKNLRHI